MKRDMDAVRALLLKMEESPNSMFTYDEFAQMVIGDGNEVVGLVQLLHSGGFLERSQKGVYRMSWAGYEFLDKIRDEEIWRKTKAGADKVGSWSVKLLGDLASGYIRTKAAELGLPLG